MAIFEPYTIEWADQELVIPADRVMRAIAVVEQHVTLHELLDVMGKRRTVQMVKLAEAYAALLTFAGFEISAEKVYAEFFSAGDQAQRIMSAVRGLQMLMIPPSTYRGAEPGNSLGGTRKAAAGSSKKRTKRPVARNRKAASG